MIVIGITGGIGSGKSYVCSFFLEQGIEVINADAIAKDLMQRNKQLKSKIQHYFGKEIYSSDGTLNSYLLSEKVFCDQHQLTKLNFLVHPVVRRELETIVASSTQSNQHHYIVIEAALIFEANMNNLMDYILLVDADEEIKIQRVIKRDNTTRESVLQRMQMQMTSREKKSYADFVLENNGTVQELKERVQFFHKLFLSLSK